MAAVRGSSVLNVSPTTMLGVLSYSGGAARGFFDPATHDGLAVPWLGLRDSLRAHRCELVPADLWDGQLCDFAIHVNAHAHALSHDVPAFAILTECPLIHPPNGDRRLLRQYRRIFTWMPELVEAGLATKIQLAHPLGEGAVDGYATRPQLLVLIAANKALPVWRPDMDLYRARLGAIRWFERYAPQDFALYGQGWDLSPRLPTRLGGALHRIERRLPWRLRWFPSWRGALAEKRPVLERARFSLVYENVRGLRGYITEKIFDAFCAGNVPIYWGAEDIEDYIPPSCFIDRRKFCNYSELYDYLRSMPESEFLNYQMAIRDFLASDQAQVFSVRCFAETIATEVYASLMAGSG